MLVSLSITSLLLTATMVAIDASFKAYANAAESASTQVSTRMVIHRVLSLVRTGTLQGPLTVDDHTAYGSGLDLPDFNGNLVTSSYMHLYDRDLNRLTLIYNEDEQMLYLETEPPGGTAVQYPLLGGVTECEFVLRRRRDASTNYEWWLERGSMDMTVVPDTNATLELEAGQTSAVRVVASTAPRRLR
ncbi:MAG: hypothetical protein AAF328_03490 [Planctomycetota bacterium]